MDERYEKEVARLHEELAALYRAGSRDAVLIEGKWARIERLERMGVLESARVKGGTR